MKKIETSLSLVRLVQVEELGGEKIELWKRKEGYDVVVIKNNDVFCTDFYEDEAVALRRYNALKNASNPPRKETG